MGRIEVREPGNEMFWITDRERSVVDAFRLRHLVGDAEAHGALRRYLRQSEPRLAKLADVARTLRATGPLSAALRVLQE